MSRFSYAWRSLSLGLFGFVALVCLSVSGTHFDGPGIHNAPYSLSLAIPDLAMPPSAEIVLQASLAPWTPIEDASVLNRRLDAIAIRAALEDHRRLHYDLG